MEGRGSTVERRPERSAAVVPTGGQSGGPSIRRFEMTGWGDWLESPLDPGFGAPFSGVGGWRGQRGGAREHPKHVVWVKNLTLYFYPP